MGGIWGDGVTLTVLACPAGTCYPVCRMPALCVPTNQLEFHVPLGTGWVSLGGCPLLLSGLPIVRLAGELTQVEALLLAASQDQN